MWFFNLYSPLDSFHHDSPTATNSPSQSSSLPLSQFHHDSPIAPNATTLSRHASSKQVSGVTYSTPVKQGGHFAEFDATFSPAVTDTVKPVVPPQTSSTSSTTCQSQLKPPQTSSTACQLKPIPTAFPHHPKLLRPVTYNYTINVLWVIIVYKLYIFLFFPVPLIIMKYDS